MRIAIMQPYFCPYLGYFQLVASVDKFIFYDDVNFIKGGWINRNKIISNNQEFLFAIPLVDASSFRLIKDTQVNWKSKEAGKLVTNIKHSYAKAPFFNEVFPIVEQIFDNKPETISRLAIDSIVSFSKYLGIPTEFKVSSEGEYEKTGDRVLNLVDIIKKEGATHYINPIGGQELYTKEAFQQHGIELSFIKGTSSLSIIDVCMKQDKEDIRKMLNDYTLI
jgi:hypothetical protein